MTANPMSEDYRPPIRRAFTSSVGLILAAVLAATGMAVEPACGSAVQDAAWAKLQRSATDALDANRYWIAEPLLKQSVTEAEKYGFDDPRLARALSELGRLYTIRGRFGEAEPYLERELTVWETALGPRDGKLVLHMGNLCLFYLNYGTRAKAEPLAEDILNVVQGKMRAAREMEEAKTARKEGAPLEGWLGAAAPAARDPMLEWSITCDSIASEYRIAGNYALAEKLYLASLDVKTTILGEGHLSLANSYDNLGRLCMDRGDYEDAVEFFKDALETTEKTLPKESPEVYSRLDRLAKCYIKSGQFEKAEELYLRALSFWTKEPSRGGDESRALFSLGSMYVDQKRYAQAAIRLKQALERSEKFNGPMSASLVSYLLRYSYCLYYLGRRGESAHYKARAFNIYGGDPLAKPQTDAGSGNAKIDASVAKGGKKRKSQTFAKAKSIRKHGRRNKRGKRRH